MKLLTEGMIDVAVRNIVFDQMADIKAPWQVIAPVSHFNWFPRADFASQKRSFLFSLSFFLSGSSFKDINKVKQSSAKTPFESLPVFR